LKKFTRGYHDERRAKEEALREREAAEKLTKQLWEQNRKLQEQVRLGQERILSSQRVPLRWNLRMPRRNTKRLMSLEILMLW
jgi:hypothetical protein